MALSADECGIGEVTDGFKDAVSVPSQSNLDNHAAISPSERCETTYEYNNERNYNVLTDTGLQPGSSTDTSTSTATETPTQETSASSNATSPSVDTLPYGKYKWSKHKHAQYA